MHEVDEGKLLQIVDGEVYTVGRHIARTIGSPTLWGLYPILKAVNPQYLTKFSWLMTTMTTSLENEDSNDYSFVMHHAITVLVGPCVFYGSIHSEVTSLQFRLEYGIVGPHIDGAATLFAENVHKNIMETEEKSHIVLDITIPVLHMEDEWNSELWKYDDIANNPIGFISSVKTAALNSKKISAKCVFFLDPERRAYQIGQKQYNFNFIRVLQQGTSCLSSLPYLSAFEGVFESHSPVRNYLAWFENVNIPEKPVQFREPTTSNTTRSRGISSLWSRPSKQQRQASGCPSNTTQEGGDLLSASDSSVSLADGPYADEVQNTLRNHFKMMISSLPGEENLFPMLHYIILLLLMDRDNEESLECLLEAMHLVQSSSYKLHLIIEKNFHLQDLIKHFLAKESSDSHLVQSQYLDYRRSIQMLFFNELQERSREYMVAGRVLLEKLDAIAIKPTSPNQTRALPLCDEVLKELDVINRYCTTVMMGMVDDALSFCPHLVRHFPTLEDKTRDLSSFRHTKHGVEMPSLMTQDNMFLNVEQGKQAIGLQGPIATSSTRLKYFVDTRFDETLETFLGDLLSGSCLPPNPYPRLVSHLRLAANSMELLGEKRDRLLSKLLPDSAQLVDSQNHIFHPPGCEAYGTLSAVSSIDSRAYNELLEKLRFVINKVNPCITEIGFKATVGACLTGFSPLYGRLMPYVHEIELEEHYFIRGPRHAKADAIQYFNKLVFDHLEGFAEVDNPSLLFVGVFLGLAGVRRSLQEIVPTQRRKAFVALLTSTVNAKQPVYIKVYVQMDWRLVLVKKSFMLHYIEGAFTKYERFYTQSPLGLYQNVFSSQEVASLFVRSCGPQDRGDPCGGANLSLSMVHVDHVIERARHDGNYLDIYRWLLTRSLMKQESSFVFEAWCMMHSTPAQLEYLQTLNRTLQALVYEELSRTFAPASQDADHSSMLDAGVLGWMFDVYCAKLGGVLERGTCMAPSGLMIMLQEKLDMVTESYSSSRESRLLITETTPLILNDINELLQPLIDASAADLYYACVRIEEGLRSYDVISTEVTGRRTPQGTR
ncbi:uncharacterized protein LOC5513700 [Nematostella vectensis]|uniref:uncharacterized protein LOC5513700 n=1 Tax=Nematostella vectensis TaxID=45351 RepID=UPI002076D9A6|nr:uncharacterized protein LOC5513700 [Nematostella vectensis]